MLPLALVEEIHCLLEMGELSQREIAGLLNVSRGTVSAISRGERGLHGREVTADDQDPFQREVPPERCPSCGGMVYMPCLLCEVRRFQARRNALAALKRLSAHHKRVA